MDEISEWIEEDAEDDDEIVEEEEIRVDEIRDEKNHLGYYEEDEDEEEEEEEEINLYEISAKLTIKLKQTFEYFDKEKHEFLPMKQIGTLMRFVGFTPNESEIKNAIEWLRMDPRGTFNFQQFFQVVQLIAREPEPDEDIVQAFTVFDEDMKGYIPSMELREVLMKLGDKLKEEEMIELLKIADKKKSGKIKYENFLVQLRKMLRKMPPILECDQPPPPDPKEKLKAAAAAKAKKKK